MNIVIKIIGGVLITVAILFLLKPNDARQVMRFFIKGNNLYFAAIVRLAVAVILLIGARQCHIVWLIITVGVLLLASAIMVFALGQTKLKRFFSWYLNQPNIFIRFAAVLVLILGSLIIYAA